MIIIVFSFDISFELFHFDLCEATWNRMYISLFLSK
jgi:hypothetical protein